MKCNFHPCHIFFVRITKNYNDKLFLFQKSHQVFAEKYSKSTSRKTVFWPTNLLWWWSCGGQFPELGVEDRGRSVGDRAWPQHPGGRLGRGHNTGHRSGDGWGGGSQLLSLVQIHEGMSVISRLNKDGILFCTICSFSLKFKAIPKRRSPRNQVSVNKNRIQLDVERFSRRKGQIKKSSEVLEQVSITNPNLRTFNTLKINLFEFDQNIENIEWKVNIVNIVMFTKLYKKKVLLHFWLFLSVFIRFLSAFNHFLTKT